jgi:hypothetical protein
MDTRNARNVAGFETITIILAGLGEAYKPGQPMIRLPALVERLNESREAALLADATRADYIVSIDAAQAAFDDFDRFVVNIKRTAAIELNDDAFTADLQAIINRSRGSSRPVPTKSRTEGDDPPRSRSSASRRRESRIALLTDMSALLKTRPDYNPPNADYSVAAIDARIASLSSAVTRLTATKTAAANANARYRAAIYDRKTGLKKLASLVRMQLASSPGRESPAYQQFASVEIE